MLYLTMSKKETFVTLSYLYKTSDEGEDEGEAELEGEFRFSLRFDLGLGSKCCWKATVAEVSVREASVMESMNRYATF